MFHLWRRLNEEDRQSIWRLYGWFTALSMCGSCLGAIAWAARMRNLEGIYQSYEDVNASKVMRYSLHADGNNWRSAFTATYPIEFMFLTAAKLMVLDRLLDFAAPQGHAMRKRLTTYRRVVLAVVVLGNAVGLLSNFVSAVNFKRTADAAGAASANYAAGNSDQGDADVSQYRNFKKRALQIASVQCLCEVAVLLVIVTAFVASGIFCARRINSMLRQVNAASFGAVVEGRHLWRQVVGTTGFVGLAFVIRSVFSVIFAVATCMQDVDNPNNCPENQSLCDPFCYNVYTNMAAWMLFTPQFQMTFVLISSPLAMLVALWGMTSKRMIALITSNHSETESPASASLDLPRSRFRP
jgi:hypothetical protein